MGQWTHFEVIFMKMCEVYVEIHFWNVCIICWKGYHLLFCHELSWQSFQKLINHECTGFISGLSILIYWSIHLSLCQYHTILISIAFSLSFLTSGSVTPPTLPSIFRALLAIWSLLDFYMNFRISVSISAKRETEILVEIASIWEYSVLNNIVFQSVSTECLFI